MKHPFRLLILLAMAASARGAIVSSALTTNTILKTWTVSAPGKIATTKTLWSASDIVEVYPGTYFETNLLAKGVNYYFFPGSVLVATNPPIAGTGFGFFDDRGTGATSNRIGGYASMWWSPGTNLDGSTGFTGNTNCVGALVVTNPASDIVLEFDAAYGASWNDTDAVPINGVAAGIAIFYVSRCTNVIIKGNSLQLWAPDIANINGNGFQNTINGIYWELGDMHVRLVKKGRFFGYSTWLNEPAGTFDSSYYEQCDYSQGYVYISGQAANPGWRSWFDYQYLDVTNSLNGCFYALGGGKHYLRAEKIEARNVDVSTQVNCVRDTGPAEIWVNAQKITANGGETWLKVDGSGIIHCTAQQYEFGVTNAQSGGAIGFDATSGTFDLYDGSATTYGVGLQHTAGSSILHNMTINTSYSNRPPVLVLGAGLSLKGCSLIVTNTTTNCITATGAQTVGVYWSAANKTNNANITMSPNAGFTVDSNVQ